MSLVEVRNHALWIKHVRKHINKDDTPNRKLFDLEAGDLVELAVDGFKGMWKKMDDGNDGRPTPGIKPLGRARDAWHELQGRSGDLVSVKEA